jgi:hypothetical protein
VSLGDAVAGHASRSTDVKRVGCVDFAEDSAVGGGAKVCHADRLRGLASSCGPTPRVLVSRVSWEAVLMSLVDETYPVRLGFAPESVAIPDPDHPGLLRAGPRASAPYGNSNIEVHVCQATDCGEGRVQPDLKTFGFDTVDLSALDSLQEACADVRAAGAIASDQAGEIRAALDGSVLRTSDGGSLRVMHIADEGFIMRTAGPNGLPMVGPRSSGMNGHGQAMSVHADQDVFGTPVTQLMDGRAPELFIHDSPDGHNHDATLLLVNFWIPLQQITQPLMLADGRSIDRRRHQLRYGLATDSFLERDEDLVINDIWSDRLIHG